MNARFYVDGIGRFASADTIVPNPANPQSLNRYSYVYNNPVKYNDPSGHCPGNLICFDQAYPTKGERTWTDYTSHRSFSQIARIAAFQLAYDHELPIKLIEHYAYGGGATMILIPSEMAESGVNIDLGARHNFNAEILELAENGGGIANVSFFTNEDATTHGTLGNFIANYTGELTVTLNEDGGITGWEFNGTVNFQDTWDFDPKEWGIRSTYGEVMTRIADVVLPGKGFDIVTSNVPIHQNHKDTSANWVGTDGIGVPSILADELNNE